MIAQAVALGAAIDWLTGLGLGRRPRARARPGVVRARTAARRCRACASSARQTAEDRGATISFVMAGIHPHDVAQLLDEQGIAVRAGHHCARPVCLRYGVPATTRASFGVYTTREEIDALVAGLHRVREVFGS